MSNKSFSYILESEYNYLNKLQQELITKADFQVIENTNIIENRLELSKQQGNNYYRLFCYYNENNKSLHIQIDILDNYKNNKECLKIAQEIIKEIKKAVHNNYHDEPLFPVFITPLKRQRKNKVLIQNLCG